MAFEYTVTTRRLVVSRTFYTVTSDTPLDIEDLDDMVHGSTPAGVDVQHSSELDEDERNDADEEITEIIDETNNEILL